MLLASGSQTVSVGLNMIFPSDISQIRLIGVWGKLILTWFEETLLQR